MNINTLNNIIGYSFMGFAVILILLWVEFWREMKKFEKTKGNPDIRILWVLSVLDGLFFLTFIVSLIIKFIRML